MWAIRFEITGEHGLPCGRVWLWQAICAIVRAILELRPNVRFFSKYFHTRPKFIVPKKSCKSILKTYRCFRCCIAFVIIECLGRNPWESVFVIPLLASDSSIHSIRRCAKCLCSRFSSGIGALIVRSPPDRFLIEKSVYFAESDTPYMTYAKPFAL